MVKAEANLLSAKHKLYGSIGNGNKSAFLRGFFGNFGVTLGSDP